MLNNQHDQPQTSGVAAAIWRVRVACPFHDYHTVYLSSTERWMVASAAEALVGHFSCSTSGLCQADEVVEVTLDDLPF